MGPARPHETPPRIWAPGARSRTPGDMNEKGRPGMAPRICLAFAYTTPLRAEVTGSWTRGHRCPCTGNSITPRKICQGFLRWPRGHDRAPRQPAAAAGCSIRTPPYPCAPGRAFSSPGARRKAGPGRLRPEPPGRAQHQENHGPGGGTAPGPHRPGGRDWDSGRGPTYPNSRALARHLGPLAPWGMRRWGWHAPAFRARSTRDAEPRHGPPPGCIREKSAPPQRRGWAGAAAALVRSKADAPGCGCAVCRAAAAAGIPFEARRALLRRRARAGVGPADQLPPLRRPRGPGPRAASPWGRARCVHRQPPGPYCAAAPSRAQGRGCAAPLRVGGRAEARAPEQKKRGIPCRSAQEIPRFFSPPTCQWPSAA